MDTSVWDLSVDDISRGERRIQLYIQDTGRFRLRQQYMMMYNGIHGDSVAQRIVGSVAP
jgi:hypothetical protein